MSKLLGAMLRRGQFSHLCPVSVNGSTYRKWNMTLPQMACLYRCGSSGLVWSHLVRSGLVW